MFRSIVVGYVAQDLIVTRGRHHAALGGAAAYFALAASVFGKVRVHGVVGDDLHGQAKRILGQRGIDLRGLRAIRGPSVRWHARYDEQTGVRTVETIDLGVADRFAPDLGPLGDDETAFVAAARPDQQREALIQAASAGFRAVDLGAEWIACYSTELLEVASLADALFATEDEALTLTKEPTPTLAAEALLSRGPVVIVIKRGDSGSTVVTRDGVVDTPALQLTKVIDPTGAGDSFAAGFLAAFRSFETPLASDRLAEAAVCGSATASFAMQAYGPVALIGVEACDVLRRARPVLDAMGLEPECANSYRLERTHTLIFKYGLAVVREGRLLLCKPYRHDDLIMPGGRKEGDETPAEGIAREVAEELGGAVRVIEGSLRRFGVYEDVAAGRPGTAVRIELYVGDLDGEPAPSQEIADLVWYHPIEDSPEQLSPIVRNYIIPALQAARMLPSSD